MTGAGPLSRRAFRRAKRSLVGGVDSPVRSYRAVGGTPVFIARGRGPFLFDLDGRQYVDLVGSWGAAILGHAPASVVRAVRAATGLGLSYGVPSPREHELAERIQAACPPIKRLRFVNSGTEAVMSAIRAARGFTGRTKILMFEGGYHGHSDGLLARAGSGVAAQSLPGSAGVPASFVGETLLAPYNDAAAVAQRFASFPGEIAAVVVEPVAGNMNLVLPEEGFHRSLGRLCREYGALLIADEVITGFRLAKGLVHPRYGVTADLVTLGKIIGGGLPIGAYGGRADVMEMVAPLGPVYQAGTLSGNPVAMAAGAATLDALTPEVYRRLERTSAELAAGLHEGALRAGVGSLHLSRLGSMLGVFFGPGSPRDFYGATQADRAAYRRFFHAMLEGGVHLPPSPLETAFVSAALGEREVERVGRAARGAMQAVGEAP